MFQISFYFYCQNFYLLTVKFTKNMATKKKAAKKATKKAAKKAAPKKKKAAKKAKKK